MENSGNSHDYLFIISFYILVFRYFIYLPIKNKIVKERREEKEEKKNDAIIKIAQNIDNTSIHDLSARIDRLEKVIEEKLGK